MNCTESSDFFSRLPYASLSHAVYAVKKYFLHRSQLARVNHPSLKPPFRIEPKELLPLMGGGRPVFLNLFITCPLR